MYSVLFVFYGFVFIFFLFTLSSKVHIGRFVVFFSHIVFFFFSSRRRHTRLTCDWSSDVCSSDLADDRARLDDRECRAPVDQTGPAVHRRLAGMGRQRLSADLRRLSAAGRAARRSEERRVGKEWRVRWWPESERKEKVRHQR